MRYRIQTRLKGERLPPWAVEAPSVDEALESAIHASEELTQALHLAETEERALGATYRIRFVAHTTWISATLEPPRERRCDSCRHWDATGVGLHGERPGLDDLYTGGVCRRFPPRLAAPLPLPVVAEAPPAPEAEGRPPAREPMPTARPTEPTATQPPAREPVWPPMPADGWCGEWSLAADV